MSDVLGGGGPDRLPRRGRRLALGVLVLLVVLGLAGDRWQRDRERDALSRQARDGSASMAYADGRLHAALVYASPTLMSPEVADTVRQSLARVVSGEAAAREPDLAAARDRVRDLRVLPWHRAQQDARRALLADLDLRLSYLTQVAGDLDVYYSPHPELAASRTRRDAAFVRAGVPPG